MKNLWRHAFRIFFSDLKKICTNWVSLVILTGLVLLPSLYAWVNIYAGWDPYGNTQGVKVAIVNLDEGCDFENTQIHIGKDVSESLKENKKLGWTFVDTEEQGLDLVQQGNVYATIIIPKDFSRKMITLLDANPMKPELEYYVNEKINAIAPKMTDSGASTIQRQIATSFVETVADKVIEILGDAGIKLDEEYPTIQHVEDMIITLDKHFPEVESGVNYLASKAQDGKIVLDKHDDQYIALQDALDKMLVFNQDADIFLDNLSTFTNDSVPKLKENLALGQNMFMDIAEQTNNLQHDLVVNKPIVLQDIDDTITKLQILKNRNHELATQIKTFDKSFTEDVTHLEGGIDQTIDTYISLLIKLKDHIDDPSKAVEILKQIQTTSQTLSKQLEQMKSLVVQLGKTIDELLAALEQIVSNLNLLAITPEDETLLTQTTDLIDAFTQATVSAPNTFQSVIPSLDSMRQTLGHLDEQNANQTLQLQAGNLSSLIQSLRALNATTIANTLAMITSAQELFLEISNSCESISHLLITASKDATDAIQSMISNLDALEFMIDKNLNTLKSSTHTQSIQVADDLSTLNQDLSTMQNRLQDLSTAIATDQTTSDLLNTVSKLSYNIQTQLGEINKGLDYNFIANIQRNIWNASGLVDDITTILTTTQKDLKELNDFAELLAHQDTILLSDVNKLQQKLPQMKKLVHATAQKLNDFNGTVNLKYLIDNMTMDNSSKSDFLASPVLLNSHKLYPMANYGAAMTPFYTTLCLWVGALLLTALLSTKAKNATFSYTPIQEFFGKYLLFLLLAMLQGFIAALGDIFVLGVHVAEPVLFVALAIFYSMIFSGIIYTLVSLFGNVGKALGVILLVLQLAGSGGTFPIQVIPEILQKLSKFLPFTYAIGGMREAVAGVMYDSLVLDLSMLIIFFVIFMIFGVLLKQKANSFLHQFAHKLGESGVIEH